MSIILLSIKLQRIFKDKKFSEQKKNIDLYFEHLLTFSLKCYNLSYLLFYQYKQILPQKIK